MNQMPNTEKGVLLIAIGSKEYLKMAVTLAHSIKNVDNTIAICLAHNYDQVDDQVFDMLVTVPEEAYTTAGKPEYIKVKTWVYDISPFQKTIFLDVDMIWLMKKPISELFAQLNGLPWTIANTGKAGCSVWCDLEEALATYPGMEFWNYHSEFIYFEKCDTSAAYWKEVKYRYLNPGLTKTTNFGGASMADELAYQLASMITKQYPHQENFLPTYWYARSKEENHLPPYKLADKYYSYSIGGNMLPQTVKQNYLIVANYHYARLGIRYPYHPQHKRSVIPNRTKF